MSAPDLVAHVAVLAGLWAVVAFGAIACWRDR